jgi:serine/threonine protein kinase
MHLNLKPENMMYFKDSSGQLILKAIDFSTSKLLNKNVKKLSSAELENRANLCQIIGHAVGSPAYSSPEIRITFASYWGDRAEDISDEHAKQVITS